MAARYLSDLTAQQPAGHLLRRCRTGTSAGLQDFPYDADGPNGSLAR